MKALFGRSQRKFPDHHNPDFSHPYYPNKSAQESNVSHIPEAQSADRNHPADIVPGRHHTSPPAGRARSTLDALQMIRRRFEESQEQMTQQLDDQAAA